MTSVTTPSRLDALVRERPRRVVKRFGEDVGEHHLHALLAEAPADGPADAPGSAGYDRHLASKVVR